jgi:SAM-dependent methyltransferase
MSDEWDRQVSEVAAALEAFDATGEVLELAGGTGWWSQRLARTADRLTVVDSSPETLDLNRKRVGRSDIEYIVTDLFSWQPQRTYDVVFFFFFFFFFWLSHVPRQRFSAFWSLVQTCLAPSGRVFVIDNRNPDRSDFEDAYVVRGGPELDLRRLHDGSQYQVVEIFYEPEELRHYLTKRVGLRRSAQRPGSSSGKRNPAEGTRPRGAGVLDVPQRDGVGSRPRRTSLSPAVGENSENAGPCTLERPAIEVDRLLPFDVATRRSPRAPRTPGRAALHRPAPDRTADVRVAARTPGLARGRHE